MAKKTKKATPKKTTKKNVSVKKVSSKKLPPIKRSIIEVVPELTEQPVVSNNGRMDFGNVDCVFNSLIRAFHPNGLENEDTDDRFIALWTLFLNCGGWTEEEFWAEFHRRDEENICMECGESLDENGEHLEEGDDETETPIKKADLKIVN